MDFDYEFAVPGGKMKFERHLSVRMLKVCPAFVLHLFNGKNVELKY